MRWLRGLLGRIGIGRRHAAIDREVQEEIRFHLDMRAAANVADGMNEREARRAARHDFGDPDRVVHAGREILSGAVPTRDGASLGETLLQDVRYGLRMLRRYPFATAVAVLSLGIGIGANTANFSIVYGFLHRPLPFADGDRLVFIDAWNPDRGDGDAGITWADIERIRAAGAFEYVGAFDERTVTVSGVDLPERVASASVTPGLFNVLGIEPQLGRLFEPEHGAAYGFEQVVLISDGIWKRMFASDPDIVGQSLRINDRELTIIAVMSPGFGFPMSQQLWLPHSPDDASDHQRRYIRGAALLAPGVDLVTAQAQLRTLAAEVEETWPDTHQGWTMRGMWFRHGYLDRESRQLLYMMFAAAGLVLLLACANVANLQLSRAPERRRELIVRAALGGSRGRLVRQMLTESVMLGLAGGVVGVVLAYVWVETIVRSVALVPAYWIDVSLDGGALLYTLGIAVGTALLFGMLPALRVTGSQMGVGLRASGRGAVSLTRRSLRSALVVGQLALAVVLLVGATLMVRSFLDVQSADAGFDHRQLLSLRIGLSGDQYDDPQARRTYFEQLRRRLNELPQVASSALTGAIPADDGGADIMLVPVGGGFSDDEPLNATAVPSTAGFFDTIGVEFVQGRDFTAAESSSGGRAVVVIGASLARRLWPGQRAVGEQVRFVASGNEYEVVGVVPDLQYEEFGEDTPAAGMQVHIPYALVAWRSMAVLVRGPGSPAELLEPVRETVAAIDPGQAPYDIMTMTERRAYNSGGERAMGQSFGAFGAMALVLAVFGVYAVIAYSVARRTHEMGVRLALGATAADVIRDVVKSGAKLTLVGVAIGAGMALAVTRLLAGLVYGVSSLEPRVLMAVTLLLAGAAIVASLLPARRAARVDPTQALRAE